MHKVGTFSGLDRVVRGRGPATMLACLAALVLCCGICASAASALPVSFGTEGEGAGQLSEEPRGVAVDQESGDVYVADRNNGRMMKFTAEGGFLLGWGWGVADGTSEALQTCTTVCFRGIEGNGPGQFSLDEGVAVDNDPLSSSHGDVYVIDAANERVQKFGPEGEFLLSFGSEGSGPGQFTSLNGRSIAVGSSGKVYVGDENRVQIFSAAGVAESEFTVAGAGRVENLAVDSAKDVYVKGQELAGVRKYDTTGTPLGEPRDEGGEGEREAIAVGPSDELFVNDFQGGVHHILTFDASGKQVASFDSGSEAADGFRGIAYSEAAKALYVLNAGKVRIVTPPAPGPFVVLGSESTSELQPTGATLGATINPEGPEATTYHFEYGTSTAYGQSTPVTELTGGEFEDQPASAKITGLQPRTTYHYRVVAENAAAEVTDGPDQTFTTLPPVSIDATSASQVQATSARLEAELNPHGLPSEYRFEYGTSTAYGTSVPVPDGSVGSGNVDVVRTNLAQELLPSTTYHYRVVAHNELGTVEGPDHTFTTQGAASALPDGRTWELVSPPNKHGSPLQPLTEEGGLIQAAPAGGALAYVSLGPINSEPKGVRSPHASQLLATRGADGWFTQDITTPHEEIAIIHAGFPSEYRFFGADLGTSIVEPQGSTPLSSDTSERTPYQREASGEFVPLVSGTNVPAGTKFGGIETPAGTGQFSNGVEFLTASPDAKHAILLSPQVLASGFEPGFEPEEASRPSLYERSSAGALTLLSVLPGGEPAEEAGLPVAVGSNNLDMRGAISDDGQRVVFETGNGTGGEHLYMRDVGLAQTVLLDELQPGAAGGKGKPVFQAASGDGARVYFTDTSRLTSDSTAQPGRPDLYLCEMSVQGEDLGCALSDVSVDHNVGEAADVQGEVSAIDASGEHVYFAANGVLSTTPNEHSEHAVPGNCNSEEEGSCNLYEYDAATHTLSLVAVLSSRDDPDWAGRTNLHVLGNLTARSSPNGRYFTFMSQRSLTGYDNRDTRNGQLDEEVYLLEASSGALSCVSCNPSGARPLGVLDIEQFPGLLVDHPKSWRGRWIAGSIPGWTQQSLDVALHQSRYLSDSGRMFFNAADSLVPQDTNSVEDAYEFEPTGVGDCSASSSSFSPVSGGCVNLISSGSSKEESAFLDASESGDEVFFLTGARLTTSDVDGAFDVYDAHVCTAASPCPPPPPPPAPACEGDACQSPGSPPSNETPGSLVYHGPGNATPAVAPPAKAKPKPLTRAQLLARALKQCKKHKAKKKRLACERSARKKYGTKAKAKSRKAGKAHKGRDK